MKLKLIAILTVILLIVVMSVPVYAETTIPQPPADAYEYWVVYWDLYNGLTLLSSNEPILAKKYGDDRIFLKANYFRLYYYEENEWKLDNYGGPIETSNYETIYASNHDIAYEDGSGFFFESPKVPPLSQGMMATDFGTILRNFSAGLIPLIGCLILVISLRKGWKFLRTQLTS